VRVLFDENAVGVDQLAARLGEAGYPVIA